MGKDKRQVIVFIDWFYPAYKAGGPIKSVYNIIRQLEDRIDFMVITSSKDLDGVELNVRVNELVYYDAIPVMYLTKQMQTRAFYRSIVNQYKPACVYYNSIFSVNFTLKPYLALRAESELTQIIAPRGMLGEGALAIKSFKKSVFLKLGKVIMFKKNIVWHASTPQEEKEIKKTFGNDSNVAVAQNLSSGIHKREVDPYFKISGSLKIIFISRISRKKNLLFVINQVASLKQYPNLEMDIYGPVEDQAYWAECQKLIDEDNRINYKGVIKPQEIVDTLQSYHFSVLPSMHENYGHSIVESILAGVPVIISQNTPWRELTEEQVGNDISLDHPELWKGYIKECIALEHKEYISLTRGCHEYASKYIVNSENLLANYHLFDEK